MLDHAAYVEVRYAARWAGLAVVPVIAKLHPREMDAIRVDSGAALIVAGEPAYDALLDGPALDCAHRAPGDLTWLFYTSGTTGRPKRVLLTHRKLYAMPACCFIDVDEVGAEDANAYAAPISHGAGLYNFAFVARGARHGVPASGGFDAAERVALSRSVGRLCLFAAPTMVKRLVDRVESCNAPVDGFRSIVIGGGGSNIDPCDVEVLLLRHPGAFEVAVVGQPDAEWARWRCPSSSARASTPLRATHCSHRKQTGTERRGASQTVIRQPGGQPS